VGPILVLAQRRAGGGVCRSTGALLTLARRLGTPFAVLCGAAADAPAADAPGAGPLAADVASLGRYGAATVYTVGGTRQPTAAAVEALAVLARRLAPAAILIAADRAGREVAARVAVRLDSGIVTDAVDIRPGPDGPVAVQWVLDRSYRVESGVVRGVPVFTVADRSVAAEQAPVDPVVHRLDVRLPAGVREVRPITPAGIPAPRRPDLATAAVVVAGGHGVGSRDSFRLVDQVADALGGAVGGSHTATQLGWCPPEAQVDLVGRVVHPRLYLALGISGSVRHRAGMRTAATIVAIDRDPGAPIFAVADLGVVGDLHEVVPELLAEIRRRKTTAGVNGPLGGAA
jgi:electron transfer flavoprotein alpha subunit